MYIKQDLEYDTTLFKFFNRSDKDIECQWVHLKNKFTRDFIIVNIYRPPQGNIETFIDYFENTISTIDTSKLDIFIMGDFNINVQNRNCDKARSLKSMMKTLGLKQLISQPTRIDLNSKTCIDLIFTNCDYISNNGTFPMNISDHEMIYCTKKRNVVKNTKKEFIGRSYRNFDKAVFGNL